MGFSRSDTILGCSFLFSDRNQENPKSNQNRIGMDMWMIFDIPGKCSYLMYSCHEIIVRIINVEMTLKNKCRHVNIAALLFVGYTFFLYYSMMERTKRLGSISVTLCISKDFQCSDNDHNIIPEKPYSDRIWAVKAKVYSTQEQASFTKINSEVEMDISPKVYPYSGDLFQD